MVLLSLCCPCIVALVACVWPIVALAYAYAVPVWCSLPGVLSLCCVAGGVCCPLCGVLPVYMVCWSPAALRVLWSIIYGIRLPCWCVDPGAMVSHGMPWPWCSLYIYDACPACWWLVWYAPAGMVLLWCIPLPLVQSPLASSPPYACETVAGPWRGLWPCPLVPVPLCFLPAPCCVERGRKKIKKFS